MSYEKTNIAGKFLYCPEARMIRYELGKTPYAGLCTGGVLTCAIFCYQSEDKQRLLLLHANHLTSKDTLLEASQWIGKNGRCKVYSRNKMTRSLVTNETIGISGLELIRDRVVSDSCDYQVEPIDPSIDGFVFLPTGDVNFLEDLNKIERIYHPHHSQMDICYKLHEFFGHNNNARFYFTGNNQLRQQLLIFDGKNWQEVKSHDLVLHPQIKNILSAFNFRSSESFLSIQNILMNDFTLKVIRNIPGYENTSDLQSAFGKMSPKEKQLVRQKMDGDINGRLASHAAILHCYLYRSDRKQGFVNNVKAELSIEPYAKTQEDKAILKVLIAALKDKDPVTSVCNLLTPLKRDTEFKNNIIGIVFGGYGLLMTYNLGNHGKWVDLSSVEDVICKSETIGLAFRTLAATGTVKQLKALAPLISNLDGSGKSGKTALHFACEHNSPEMVACLLDLGANSQLTDAAGKMPIEYCKNPASIALIEGHASKDLAKGQIQ